MNSTVLALRLGEKENHSLLPRTHMKSLLFKRKNLAKRDEIGFPVATG